MKKIALTAFTALFFLSGCGYHHAIPIHIPSVRFTSTIPFYTLTVKIVNSTILDVEVIDDQARNIRKLLPGEVMTQRFWNLSGSSHEISLVAIAKDEKGSLFGTATRNFQVSGSRKQSETWVLRSHDFR